MILASNYHLNKYIVLLAKALFLFLYFKNSIEFIILPFLIKFTVDLSEKWKLFE